MDPTKRLTFCLEPRDYRQTTMHDIHISKEDKRRGGGPRVGPFQEHIPGDGWEALPKYDFTTKNRSSAFNERMHVEWENHVDHILKNDGELPTASVVAKAGFRSCAPCCRDMLALARPTGKTFIMVDLAEDDTRGTFHFVTGDRYLPVPKEACTRTEVDVLKKVVSDAQAGVYGSSDAIHRSVVQLGVPIDETAQSLYLNDPALLPPGCAENLKGTALLQVLHAEHFARLSAEYGASIIRSVDSTAAQQEAISQCRAHARNMLVKAWQDHILSSQFSLDEYAAAAVSPLLPETSSEYLKMRRAMVIPRRIPTLDYVFPTSVAKNPESRRWSSTGGQGRRAQRSLRGKSRQATEDVQACAPALRNHVLELDKTFADDDAFSIAAPSTTVPDDLDGTFDELSEGSDLSEWEDPCPS